MMILNEEKYARDILLGKNTFEKTIIRKIGYITRYNFHILNKNDTENYNSTVKWLLKHQVNFDESSYSNVISNAIKSAKKHPFYVIDCIKITKNELCAIKSLENLREEKILFSLLCMAKQQMKSFGFTDGLVKYTVTDLCKMARVSVPANDREYILHDILLKGFIECPKKNDTKCLRLNFIDEDGEGEIGLILNEIDCQEIAYTYLKWKNGDGFKRCSTCGRLIRSKQVGQKCTYCKSSNYDGSHIWCIDCGEEIEVLNKDMKTCRCETCKKEYIRKYDRERKRK